MENDCLEIDFYERKELSKGGERGIAYPFKIVCKETGFKDRFGNKIYEYDLVKYKNETYWIYDEFDIWYASLSPDEKVNLDTFPEIEIERIGNTNLEPDSVHLYAWGAKPVQGFKYLNVYVFSSNKWEEFYLTESRLKILTTRQKKVIDLIHSTEDGKINGGYKFKPYLEVQEYSDVNVYRALSIYADNLGYK